MIRTKLQIVSRSTHRTQAFNGTTIFSTEGYQTVDVSMPLTFNDVLGRSVPCTDFLQLAEGLEIKTSIRTMHKPLASEPTVAAA